MRPPMPLAASTTTRSGLTALGVDEGENALDEGRPDVVFLDFALARDLAETGQGTFANLGQARVAADRQGTRAARS